MKKEKSKETIENVWNKDVCYLWDSITQEIRERMEELNISIPITCSNPQKGVDENV